MNTIKFLKLGDYTLVDEQGKVLYGPCHKLVHQADGNIRVCERRVENEGKDDEKTTFLWGIIDFDGNELLPPKYEFIEQFKNGYARIKENSAYGLIDDDYTIVISPVYTDLGEYTQNGMYARLGTKYGILAIVNGKKEIKVPYEYKHVRVNNKGVTTLFNDDINADDVINL